MVSGNTINSNAIEITATNGDIVVYGMNKASQSCDSFMAIPTTYLGTSYFAVAHFPATKKTQIGIVASEDATTVTVTLPRRSGLSTITIPGATLAVGVAGSFTMSRYQTAQIQSNGDLSGTKITSNKKIGVLSGNVETDVSPSKAGGDRSHLVEMMPPVNQWGETFMARASTRADGDVFKVIPSQDTTLLTIGTTTITLTEAGNDYTFRLTADSTVYIKANKPVMVTQFLRSLSPAGGAASHKDPAMMVLPPREQWRPMYPFFIVRMGESDYKQYIVVVIEFTKRDGLLMDGVQVSLF